MSQLPPNPTNLRGAVDLSGLVNRPQPGEGDAGGAAQGEPVELPSLFFQGTDANFNDFIDLSMRIPVVVALTASWADPDRALATVLDRVTNDLAGRVVLVQVDVDANPQLVQAFQAQSAPAVAGIVSGRPVQLFTGALPEDQVRDVFAQLLELAVQNGVTGTAQVDAAAGETPGAETPGAEADEPAPEPPLPPLHAEAYDAIDRGDYPAAITAYRTAIAQDPRDQMAIAGLAQVSLLARLAGRTLDEIRNAAATAPGDSDAQLAVADLDLSGGHVDDAFDRLLTLFPTLDAEGKEAVRARILEYFEIVGVEDHRVGKARARLASLLY